MHLCFGVVASILNCCRQGVKQSSFVARIAYCLDKESTYITPHDQGEIEGDDPAANKLLRCKRDYVFSRKDIPYTIELSDVIRDFRAQVEPWIDEDQKPAILLTLLHIIGQDTKIDAEKKATFKRFMGIEREQLLRQNTFVFSDFLCRLLLYVTGSNIPNTTGQSFIGFINKELILNTRNFYQNEYQWNDETQTLVLLFQKMFDIFEQALHTYAIKDFIENIDPTNRLDITYVEKSEAFIQYIQRNISMLFEPSALENPGFTVQKLQKFTKTLDDYTTYLGKNLRLLDPTISTDLFVPIYRDENSKAELAFASKTFAYRKQLISIYQEICEHMIANKIPFLSEDTK